MLTPKSARKLQIEIYKKMPTEKKLKICSQFYLLGKKLSKLREQIPMSPEELLCKITKILERLKIPYIVTGGFAVSVWGKPRFTADIDILIKLSSEKIPQLIRNLSRVDKDVYVPDEATAKEVINQKGEFNFIHPSSGLKVDFWTKGYPFERFENGIPKKIGRQKVIFISPEDLILSKLEWYKKSKSQRHTEDIKSILEISKVDLKYIKKWAVNQSTIKILEKLIR